jgi:hypothetical protein
MKRTISVGLRSPMGPCTSDHRSVSQSIKLLALMAATTIYASARLTGSFSVRPKPPEQRGSSSVLGVLALILALAMPRVRGKPRRGAGWYAADSRRKRHRKFERAVIMAKQRRRRVNTVASSPPRTFVEEDPDMELPPDFSESKMFIVPDNWNPPTCIVDSEALLRSKNTSGPCATHNKETTTCLVEEEPPEDTTELQPNKEPLGRREMDDKPQTPPSPPLLHPEHLQLIFEVRSLVDDQIFRAVCVSQRLDMLYAAYSSATPRRQCPTCAQPYVIPASDGKATDAHEDSGE